MQKTLEQMILEERRAYYKKWRDDNKDKVKNYNAAYWKRRVDRKIKENPHNEGV